MRQNSKLRGSEQKCCIFFCIQISCSQSKILTMQSSFGTNVYFGRKKNSRKIIYDYLHNAHKFAMMKSPWHMDHAHMLTLVVLYCFHSFFFLHVVYICVGILCVRYVYTKYIGGRFCLHAETGFKRINLF